MRKRILSIFDYLNENNISYFLLRPIDLNEAIMDIDLIIPKPEFYKLVDILDKTSFKVFFKYSPANTSIQLFIDEVLLDIKFHICFLPRKTLVFSKEKISFSNIRIEDNQYIYPNTDEEILFTLWSYHLFLDKEKVNQSTSFYIYKSRYIDNWSKLSQSTYFRNWTTIIFKQYNIRINEILTSFFNNNFCFSEDFSNKNIKDLAVKANNLFIKFYIDKLRFQLLRKIGWFSKLRSISFLLKTKHL